MRALALLLVTVPLALGTIVVHAAAASEANPWRLVQRYDAEGSGPIALVTKAVDKPGQVAVRVITSPTRKSDSAG